MSATPAAGAGQAVSPIDWEFAVRVGARTSKAQPEVSAAEAARAVADLRAGAAHAAELVNDWCELGGEVGQAPLQVVDREGWIRANTQTFSVLLEPAVSKLLTRTPGSRLVRTVGSRAAGAEMGALLGFLGSRVLGQFDPFHGEHGRLLLVAPNVVQAERDLDVDPDVFRLWVCLHEEAHRVQFTSVPWLRDHVRGLVEEVTSQVDATHVSPEAIARAVETIRGTGEGPSAGLAAAFASPAQLELLERVTGVMSLLEGHADVAMDAVGDLAIDPAAVRSVRRKFNERRKGVSTLDRLTRRLLGLEAKAAQYRDGYRFVQAVTDSVGKSGFNAVFTSPDTLPSKAEILDPPTWVRRVHG